MTHYTARSGIGPPKYIRTTRMTVNESAQSSSILKERYGGKRHSSETNSRVPRGKLAVVTGQRRVLQRSGRSDGQAAAKEPRSSSTHRNSVVGTGGRIAPKRRMGSVVLGRGCKTRRTVSLGVETTPAVTGKNGMRTESHVQPESEVCVSCRTVDHDGP